jgi:hypothetical protein
MNPQRPSSDAPKPPAASGEGESAAERRKAPRVPVLTQVETQGELATALGRSRDISVGGLQIETPETFTEGAVVIVRFFLPGQPRPIETAGRVVRVASGKSMGICFMGLRRVDEERIVAYIQQMEQVDAKQLSFASRPSSAQERRSVRIPRRMSLVLNWQDEEGRPQQEAAETQLLSQHGAMVMSFTELQPGQILRLAVPDSGKQGVSRVVWVRSAQLPGRVEIGLEVLGAEDFWGVEFPPPRPASAAPETQRRRRGGRMLRRTPVVLRWTDELGRPREERGETVELSPHGALVDSPAALPFHRRFRLEAPEIRREAEAEVIRVQSGSAPGRTLLGIEFVEVEDFWDVAFPPESPH